MIGVICVFSCFPLPAAVAWSRWHKGTQRNFHWVLYAYWSVVLIFIAAIMIFIAIGSFYATPLGGVCLDIIAS